jgi:hypothetical protein
MDIVSKLLLNWHIVDEVTILSVNTDRPLEKMKKLSYKDDISIPIQQEGQRIVLDQEYLSQEQAKVQREELPYFWNLVQAAEGGMYLIASSKAMTDIFP